MLLRLIADGYTLILSGATAYKGVTYIPQEPELTIRRVEDILQSGDLVQGVTLRNVSESCEVVIGGLTEDVIEAANDIEHVLSMANAGRPVYVEYQPRDSRAIYRSRVYAGGAHWSDNPGLRMLQDANTTIIVTITWERDYFWEGQRQEIALASSSQSTRTGGVYAYTDATRNYVQIAAAQVSGVIPAPVEFRIANRSGSALGWRNFYWANNVWNNPNSFVSTLTGAGSVNGSLITWTSTGSNHDIFRFAWRLTAAQVAACGGDRFRVLAAFKGISSRAYVKAHVGSGVSGIYRPWYGGNEVYTGEGLARELYDLGSVPVPAVAGATKDVAVMLSIRSLTAGSAELDFVQLMPARSARTLIQNGYNVGDGAAVVDNQIDKQAYVTSGADRLPIVAAYGPPALVWPERDQRCYILFDEGTGFTSARRVQVSAYYRPRRLTV